MQFRYKLSIKNFFLKISNIVLKKTHLSEFN